MLCVIAVPEKKAAVRLAALAESAVSGFSGRALHGHITIASYTGNEEESFIRSCRDMIGGFPAFGIIYERIEVLEETSVIVAVPQSSGPLRMMHERIEERYGNDLDQWTRGSTWYPHTTLLYDPDADLRGLCRKMSETFVPFRADIRIVEFSRGLDRGFEIASSLTLRENR